MKNRIHKLFANKKSDVLSVYFTAGYPQLDNTMQILHYLEKAGVDLIEIGIPFSDPLADGLVIQGSNTKAIENGMTLETLFKQLNTLRKITDIPVILMGYLNPIMQFGVEPFLKNCHRVGIDGIIIPDLPIEEYTKKWQKKCKTYNITISLLITPQTPVQRIKAIDQIADGFVYVVSSNSITGSENEMGHYEAYYSKINQMVSKNKTLIGFGINNSESFMKACKFSNGAVVGSAFINHITKNGVNKDSIETFVKNIRS